MVNNKRLQQDILFSLYDTLGCCEPRLYQAPSPLPYDGTFRSCDGTDHVVADHIYAGI